MPTLASELRNKLERVVIDARDAAEVGARAALEALAVHHDAAYPHMKPAQVELRHHLRARALQLGDRKLPKPDGKGKDQEINHLVAECAYEHWHRMLFARFLAENGLLIEPQENMAISLAEAEELAKEDSVDVWVFVSRCAERMLPQIFRPDDPLLQVSFAAEHMLKLEKLLASLSQDVFTASDALGWVYQFWQSKKKDEVNRSEVKIGADEIAAVTQIFTEPYMVEFLLHNTLGAWWAGKKLAVKDAASAKTEDKLRRKLSVPGVSWEYLRFVRGEDGKGGPWRPAAGTFEGWPKTAAELKVLDPCCGSGHFLVAALHHLAPIRMTEEGLSEREAVDAVLRDNLHGLEIDERCCQIAAFAVAFAAWTYPGAGGYRALPDLQIACTGIAPNASKEQWLRLGEEIAAEGGMPARRDLFDSEDSLLSASIKQTLEALHELFSQAPVLGSLINPAKIRTDLFHAEYKTVAPLLSAVLEAEGTPEETREQAIAAAGMVKAADLLTKKHTLVITNVPYLGRGDQNELLKAYIESHHRAARADLATAFVDRCLGLLQSDRTYTGTLAVVVPQNWLFLTSYRKFRENLLACTTWHIVARLGPAAFRHMNWWAANTALVVLSGHLPEKDSSIAGLDVSSTKDADLKAAMLRGNGDSFVQALKSSVAFADSSMPQAGGGIITVVQALQLANPDARIVLGERSDADLLGNFAEAPQGIKTGDDDRYRRRFWECSELGSDWRFYQSTPDGTGVLSGMTYAIDWRDHGEHFARLQGQQAWGRDGIAVGQMNSLPRFLYWGDIQDSNINVIVPSNPADLVALAAFVLSDEFSAAIRAIDQKVAVTNATMVKVPFDVSHWRRIAEKEYPNGFPEPDTTDPSQWPFAGWPEESTAPLHTALARLLGYRWPAELDERLRLSKRARTLAKRCEKLTKFAADDGIVCIPAVRGVDPAAERLEGLLAAAGMSPAKVRELAGGSDLDDWLRDGFFEEHCRLFHNRPFVWHIWDGRKRDGFHALVNYHKLCEEKGGGRKLLESLTYSYLGGWITRQKDGVKRGEGGADDRLAAATELQNRLRLILEGEPPFDLFARWKPLAEQPIGWAPDINDGVRVNIRPFLASDLPAGRAGAGVLRWKPNINWTKDRGKEPKRPQSEFPWFWSWDGMTQDFMGTGKEPDGNRHNDCHYTNKAKQAARDAAKKGSR